MFQGSSKEVSRMFQERFYGASRKFQGCLKKVLRGFQWSFKWVTSSMGVLGKFLRCFKNVSREIKRCS